MSATTVRPSRQDTHAPSWEARLALSFERVGGVHTLVRRRHFGPLRVQRPTIIPAHPVHKIVEPRRAGTYQARLFDIPWTLGTLLGIDAELRVAANRMDAVPSDQEIIGRSLITIHPNPDEASGGSDRAKPDQA